MQKIFKNEDIPMKELDSLSLYMILGTVIGARLGHVLFYEFKYFMQNPLEIFMIWHGGLASHGAAIGLLTALYLYTRKSTKKSYLWTLDRTVIPIALAAVFIRTGNLMNSEIYGHTTQVSWAFIFHQVDEQPRHPTQIYESIFYLITFAIIIREYWRNKGLMPNGRIFGIFLIGIFFTRFFVEFFKENQATFESSLPINMGQILSIPFVLAGVYFLIKSRNYEIKKDPI